MRHCTAAVICATADHVPEGQTAVINQNVLIEILDLVHGTSIRVEEHLMNTIIEMQKTANQV